MDARVSRAREVWPTVALLCAACASPYTPPKTHDLGFGTKPDLSIPASTMDDLSVGDLALVESPSDGDEDLASVDLATVDATAVASSAALVINELNERMAGGLDLVELKALQAGSVSGYTLYQDITTATPAVTRTILATLPPLTVQVGDLVVVHLKAGAGVTTETNVTGMAGCTDATCPATAWDVVGSSTQDLTDSARVITLDAPGGTIIDGLAYSNGSGPASWPAQLQALQAAGVWDPTPCPNACAKADADTLAVATGSTSTGVQTTFVGNSVQRMDAVTPSGKGHFTIKASTWGAAN